MSSITAQRHTAPAEAAGREQLDMLLGHVADAERHLAKAVALAGELAGSGVCERVEGLPLEQLLGLAGRLTGADRRMLVAAGEGLRHLPVTAGLFADGVLSWGQVRRIVADTRRLPVALRAAMDAQIGATAREHGGLDGFDPDQLTDAVTAACERLRDASSIERREQQRSLGSFCTVQQTLDGWVEGFFRCDPILGAGIVNALDAAADQPTAGDADAGAGGEQDTWGAAAAPQPAGEDAQGGVAGPDACADGAAAPEAGDADLANDNAWEAVTARGRQRAQALGRICAAWLGGGNNRPARPLLVAHLDIAQITNATAAVIQLNLPGGLPRISLALLDQLTGDADLRTVLFDGARPLAVSRKTKADRVPADVRFAVAARDLGDRFPASRAPLAWCDVHHLRQLAHGGDHHPDNLVSLSRRSHTRVHRDGWRLTLDPATGAVTATRGTRRWRSLPHGTALSPAPEPTARDPEPAGAGPDPPRSAMPARPTTRSAAAAASPGPPPSGRHHAGGPAPMDALPF